MTENTATASPDALSFAYWVPNVSGGLVTSDIEQRTHFDFDFNVRVAQLAERRGFDYALSQVRYAASYGADQQHESTSFSLGLLLATERLKVIAAVHPGLWHPGVLAKWIITADHMSHGRAAVNVVSGWLKDEFVGFGEPWLEHGERYRRTEEFIRVLRGLWTEQEFTHLGDFYRIHDFTLKPPPVAVPGRAHPEIFMGGNSTDAREMGGRVTDWYFSNGKDYAGFEEQRADVIASARAAGRTQRVKFGLNGFVIARDTEREAQDVQQAGASTGDGKGMWSDSTFRDLVQYNDGFRTGLIGTPEQIARRMVEYRKRGVDLLLLGFLHYLEDIEVFGTQVLPIVRELEREAIERGELEEPAA
jgi:FMNH2-dependent dimethyl sulfone monooxygenase